MEVKPNIALEIIRTHIVITRGLTIASNNCKLFSGTESPDKALLEGFLNYTHCLMQILDAHHKAENEIAFPFYKTVIAEMPIELLMKNHEEIVVLISQINKEMEEYSKNPDKKAFDRIEAALESIITIWYPHIRIEERFVNIDSMDKLVETEKQAKLIQEMREFSMKHMAPDYLVMPFILYNLSKQDREALAGMLPPILTQKLVPIDWKPKWETMKRYLLK